MRRGGDRGVQKWCMKYPKHVARTSLNNKNYILLYQLQIDVNLSYDMSSRISMLRRKHFSGLIK